MKYGKSYTTINTDAGIKIDIKVAAYAYYIVSDDKRFSGSNKLKKFTNDTTRAEMCAILNALYIVSEDEYLRTRDIIVVNCDNMNSLSILKQRSFGAKYSDLSPTFDKIISKIKGKLSFRHVKGHSNKKAARNVVNNIIDKRIREHYK